MKIQSFFAKYSNLITAICFLLILFSWVLKERFITDYQELMKMEDSSFDRRNIIEFLNNISDYVDDISNQLFQLENRNILPTDIINIPIKIPHRLIVISQMNIGLFNGFHRILPKEDALIKEMESFTTKYGELYTNFTKEHIKILKDSYALKAKLSEGKKNNIDTFKSLRKRYLELYNYTNLESNLLIDEMLILSNELSLQAIKKIQRLLFWNNFFKWLFYISYITGSIVIIIAKWFESKNK